MVQLFAHTFRGGLELSTSTRYRESQPVIPPKDSAPKLPSNLTAEWWVIGSCLIDPSVIPTVARIVTPLDFFRPEYGQLLEVFISRHRQGQPIDPLLVAQEIAGDSGRPPSEMVQEFLEKLQANIPTAANAEKYANIVKAVSEKRQVIALANDIVVDSEGKSARELINTLGAFVDEKLRDNGATATSEDSWQRWQTSLDQLERQTYYEVAGPNSQLQRIGIGPEQFVLVGAPPGWGKTALVAQLTLNALMFHPELVGLICNCEMDPGTLLDRQVSRLSGVPYSVIRDRTYRGERMEKVKQAAKLLLELKPRLHFLNPPFAMSRVRDMAKATGAGIILIDYVQRFRPSTSASDARQVVTDVVNDCRELAMSGPAVLGVSAMSRQGQLRESSELEYGCDSCFILKKLDTPSHDGGIPLVAECLKNRNGAPEDIELTFYGSTQEHVAAPEVQPHEEFAAYAGGDFAE